MWEVLGDRIRVNATFSNYGEKNITFTIGGRDRGKLAQYKRGLASVAPAAWGHQHVQAYVNKVAAQRDIAVGRKSIAATGERRKIEQRGIGGQLDIIEGDWGWGAGWVWWWSSSFGGAKSIWPISCDDIW